ncbi:MAG: NAD(P) transhydrogenase subunit alpha [Bacteroidales bacterium]
MIIGIPKEIMKGESRVSATPETVGMFVNNGFKVMVEKNAGLKSFFLDEEYVKAGAIITDSAKEIFEKAQIILKVKEPQFNEEYNTHEVDLMHKGQYLITFLHPASPPNHKMVSKLAENGIIGLTLDGIPRISRAQTLDALTSMSTCAGYKGILLAANALPEFVPSMFSAVGFEEPANVLVVGVGVAGLQALATAKRLGAVTYAADIRPAAVEQATSLGAQVIELGVPQELAVAEGGYAKKLPQEWIIKEQQILSEHLPKMDIVFLSALIPGKVAPILVTKDMVKSMKHGSVIVDISVDQGGNCEVTPPGTTEVIDGVTVIGIKNIPGMLPKSSTQMFSKNLFHLVEMISKDGEIILDTNDEIIKSILVTYDGKIVHEGTLEAMNL